MARSTYVILGIAAVLIIAVVLLYVFYLNHVRPSMIGGVADISDTQSHVMGVEFVFDIPVYLTGDIGDEYLESAEREWTDPTTGEYDHTWAEKYRASPDRFPSLHDELPAGTRFRLKAIMRDDSPWRGTLVYAMVEVTTGKYRGREYAFIIEELFKEPREAIDHEVWFAPEEGEVLEFRDVIHTIGE